MEAGLREGRALIEGKSRDELLALARGCEWWHDIDLGGLVTKGRVGRSPLIERAFDLVDFRGKKVLDIGCWDGLWSFEAEARGAAEVHSVDYISLRSYTEHPTYLIAHRLRGSKARYYPNLSVYDIERLGVADFDVVIYTGIYYHLLEPLRAFAALHAVTKVGGLMVVEGPVLDGVDRARADFYARTWFKEDPTNWYVPSMACLRAWLECSHFDVVQEFSIKRDLAAAAPSPEPPASLARRLRRGVGGLLRGAPAPAAPKAIADDEDRVSLIARATSIGERLGTLPQIAALPPLAAAPGITPEAAAGFAEAAALFRAARPWEHIGPERTILLDMPMFSPRPVFLMVAGRRGGHRALILFLQRPAVALHLQGSLLGALATWAPFLAAFLGVSDAPATQPQAVFNEGHAYPAPDAVHSVRRPVAYQLQALEACLRAVPGFVEAHAGDANAVRRSSVAVAGTTVDLVLSWVNYGLREL